MSDTNKQNSCTQKPCLTRSYVKQDPEDVNSELRGRPVLYTGVVWIGIVRRFLIPRTCISKLPRDSSAVPKSVSHTAAAPAESKLLQLTNISQAEQDNNENEQLRRRQKKSNHSSLANLVSQIQEASAMAVNQVQRLSEELSSLVQGGKTTTSDTIESMRAEHAVVIRCGAVTVSGLVGYMIGLRRGGLTRVVYSVTGAAAMATICYPEETRYYNSRGLGFVRHIIIFSLTLLRDGPRKAFGIVNPEADQSSDANPHQSQSQSTSLRKSFGTLGHHHERSNLKGRTARQESGTTKENVSSINQPADLQTKIPQTPTVVSSQEEKLSTQCDPNIVNSLPANPIPTLPELPPAPSMGPGNEYFFENYQNRSDQTLNENNTTIKQKVQPTPHPHILHDSRYSLDKHDETNIKEGINEVNSEKYTNSIFEAIPSPDKPIINDESKLGNEQNYLKNENHRKHDEHPLNKKLSRYYLKRPKDSLETPGEGYDDLYSKRS